MNKEIKQYYVEVCPLGADFKGKRVLEGIMDLSIKGIKEVKTSKLYKLAGSLGKNEKEILNRIAGELLADPVMERFLLVPERNKEIEVLVFYRTGVMDVAGNRIKETLEFMGIKGIVSASSGAKYIFRTEGELPESKLRYISEKLLFNKIIETVEIKNV